MYSHTQVREREAAWVRRSIVGICAWIVLSVCFVFALDASGEVKRETRHHHSNR